MLFKIFSKDPHSCDWIRKKFSEYLDGVLAEKDRLQVHEHVKFCEPCSSELDDYCKMLSVLVDYREECLPAAIGSYRLPRSSFLEIFPTIHRKSPPLTISLLAPYLTALLLFLAALSSYDLWERHVFHRQYNASNYVEVVAKI